ncbi:MAG TPA: hypothetical protein VJY33_01720, partial [Isosphaeraceae bacterium]|nr:hypothetical protein [Isosphaeraceae bacterium]
TTAVAVPIRIPCGVAGSLAGQRSCTGGGTTPGPSRLRLLPSRHPTGPQDNKCRRRVRGRVLLEWTCFKPEIHARYSVREATQVAWGFDRLRVIHWF